MDLLIILTYAAFCYAVFRIFRIPFNQWTGTTAVLGGMFLIGTLLLVMNYNHPYTSNGRIYFVTVPIVPAVPGVVTEVVAQANTPLRRGDVLFRLDARPFEFAVQRARAALAEGEQTVRELATDVDRARGALAEEIATRDRVRQAYDRYAEGNEGARRAGRQGPFSELEIENRRQLYLAAEASVQSARATLQRSELVASSQIDGVNTTIARLRAELGSAEWSLEQTVVRAPGDGIVTQVLLRPGMMAASLPLRPVMVFIPDEGRYFYGAFLQESLQRVQPGDAAEIAFDGLPGQVVQGRVVRVQNEMAPGQVSASGDLIDPELRPRAGRVLAEIEITEDVSGYRLPGGATGSVALYTEHFHHVAVMRKVLLRMIAWRNYVFSDGH